MKRLLFVLFAVLLAAGSAFALSIPQSEDATTGPGIVLMDVYVAAAVDAGDVVVWDVGSSTGDNDNWVATTTTADTYIVAGVVYPAAIAAGDTGTIAVRGPVPVDWLSTSLGTAGALACSSGTAGDARNCGDTLQSGDPRAAAFGYVTQAKSSSSAIVYLFGKM